MGGGPLTPRSCPTPTPPRSPRHPGRPGKAGGGAQKLLVLPIAPGRRLSGRWFGLRDTISHSTELDQSPRRGGQRPGSLRFPTTPANPGSPPPVAGKSRWSARGRPEPRPGRAGRPRRGGEGRGNARSEPGCAARRAGCSGPRPRGRGGGYRRRVISVPARWPRSPSPARAHRIPTIPAARSPVSLRTAPSLPLWPSPPAPSSAMVLR